MTSLARSARKEGSPVPDNLNALGRSVMGHYSVTPSKIEVIQRGEMKTVWKVTAREGLYCLKRLRHPLEKMRFSIQAQAFLADKGALVPKIIKTKAGELYVVREQQVFVLYEWLEGKSPRFGVEAELKESVKGLARFHQASRGFVPPVPCRESTKWGKWPDHYQQMLSRCEEWSQSKQFPALRKVLSAYLDDILKQGRTAQTLLQQSIYPKWIRSDKQKGLCHQDYGEGNALLTKQGAVVIDLDNVTYDLPIRDMRKIILKQMSDKGGWDPALYTKIVSWYTAVNPLSQEELRVLHIDCLFPYKFHDTAKNPFLKQKQTPASDLKIVGEMERKKREHLLKLL
jgi:spore coat protein I